MIVKMAVNSRALYDYLVENKSELNKVKKIISECADYYEKYFYGKVKHRGENEDSNCGVIQLKENIGNGYKKALYYGAVPKVSEDGRILLELEYEVIPFELY